MAYITLTTDFGTRQGSDAVLHGAIYGIAPDAVITDLSHHITPQDMLATVLKMFGLDPKLQFMNHQGRPVYVVENGRPISELF